MPIRFRCGYCQKLLGIARRKAGTQTTCPHCGATITVPVPDDSPDQTDLDEIDALLKASPPLAPTPKPAPPAQATPPAAATTGERPLFERDVDAVLGTANKTPERSAAPKPSPAPTSGFDASSLANTAEQVIGSSKTTVMVVAVVVLLTVAFVAGFLIANR